MSTIIKCANDELPPPFIYKLYLCPQNEEIREKYTEIINSRTDNPRDSGFDLYIPEVVYISSYQPGNTSLVDHQIKTKMVKCIEPRIVPSGIEDSEYNLYQFTKEVSTGYYLYPRSSISKTPLILANHVGIIDPDYRGNIKAAFKKLGNIKDMIDFHNLFESNRNINLNDLNKYKIEKYTRLVQICSPNLEPFQVELVNSLDDTERGSGSFGSTGM